MGLLIQGWHSAAIFPAKNLHFHRDFPTIFVDFPYSLQPSCSAPRFLTERSDVVLRLRSCGFRRNFWISEIKECATWIHMICLIMFAMLLFWRRFKNCDGKQRLKTLHHTVPANIFIQYLHSSIQTPKRKTIKKTLSRTKINVQVNQESHTNKIGNRQDICISIRASSFWQSSPRNCCLLIFCLSHSTGHMSGHWLSFQIDKQHQNSNKIRKHRKLIRNPCFQKFYLCTVPRHHRHQPATHCPKNRFQLLTKLHKERNKIAAEAAEATTHTKKNDDDDDNDEGGRTKTKEEGRRTKDECRRTRTNTQFLVTSCVCLPFLVSPLLFLEAWTIGCSKSLCVFV